MPCDSVETRGNVSSVKRVWSIASRIELNYPGYSVSVQPHWCFLGAPGCWNIPQYVRTTMMYVNEMNRISINTPDILMLYAIVITGLLWVFFSYIYHIYKEVLKNYSQHCVESFVNISCEIYQNIYLTLTELYAICTYPSILLHFQWYIFIKTIVMRNMQSSAPTLPYSCGWQWDINFEFDHCVDNSVIPFSTIEKKNIHPHARVSVSSVGKMNLITTSACNDIL